MINSLKKLLCGMGIHPTETISGHLCDRESDPKRLIIFELEACRWCGEVCRNRKWVIYDPVVWPEDLNRT